MIILRRTRGFKRGAALISMFLLFGVLISPVFAQGSSRLWGDLEPGEYDVGFRIENLEDSGNVIEAMIWYPTKLENKREQRMLFREYVSLRTQFSSGYNQEEIRKWLSGAVTGDADTIDGEAAEKILNSQMYAVEDAPVFDKSFPLVFWTARHETMIGQSVLSEFLASYGFTVVYARNAAAPMRLPWTISRPEEKRSVFAAQLRDQELALKGLEGFPDIDSSRVAIFNWSYAAELAPRIQANNPNVRLVVGLSSNSLSSAGVYLGSPGSDEAVKVDRLTVPYVYMTERIGTNGKERGKPELFGKIGAETFFLSFPKLSHGNFNVVEGMIPGLFGIEKVQPWSKSGLLAKQGYETISQFALRFAFRHLRNDEKTRMKSLKVKTPRGFVNLVRYGPSK